MVLDNIWVLIAATTLIVVAVVAGLLLGRFMPRPSPTGNPSPVSRAERLRTLPSFAQAVRRRQLTLGAVLVLGALAVVGAGVVAARPVSAQTVQPTSSNRDIMLCLDVSGSMTDVVVEVIDVFDDLIDDFKGERIGLTIFNSSPVQVFPLTDGYDFAKAQLQNIRASVEWETADRVPEHWRGTLNGAGASLIGDGLAACTLRFDNVESERSRTIILATDNEVNGASIVSLVQAAHFAQNSGVRVFGINPVVESNPAVSVEFEQAAEVTGGKVYALQDSTSVAEIVALVQAEDASELQGQARVIWFDTPNLWIMLVVVLSAGFVVVMWRVRL